MGWTAQKVAHRIAPARGHGKKNPATLQATATGYRNVPQAKRMGTFIFNAAQTIDYIGF
jgi:hypothetical protein